MARAEFAAGKWIVVAAFKREPIKVTPEYTHPNTTSCQRCGQAISNCVVVRQENSGIEITVGTDCAVTLEGGPALAEIRAAQRKWEREEWERLYGAAYRAEKAEKEAARAAIGLQNEVTFAAEIDRLKSILASEYASSYEKTFANYKVKDWLEGRSTAPLSEKDRQILAQAERNMAIADGGHLPAEPKKRVKFSGICHAIISPHPDSRFPSWRHIFHTDDGQVVMWKTAAVGSYGIKRGCRVTLVGTVQEHTEYKGVKQTIVQRCKVVEVVCEDDTSDLGEGEADEFHSRYA